MPPQDPNQPPIVPNPVGSEPPATASLPQADPALPPIDPTTIAHKKDTILAGPDPKKNPFGEHIARPKEVPLARPEYEHPEQVAAQVPNPVVATQQAYEFITQAPKTAKRSLQLTNTLPKRIAVVAIGLILLMVVFSVGKSLLIPGPKVGEVVASVQRQQEILHVLAGALQQPNLSATNKGFALTAQLSLGTSQGGLIGYLQKTGTKLAPKELGLKINATVDSQLSASTTNNAYNETFKSVMESQFTAYMAGLKKAYLEDTGKIGRQLLNDDYSQAELLLRQLQSPDS